MVSVEIRGWRSIATDMGEWEKVIKKVKTHKAYNNKSRRRSISKKITHGNTDASTNHETA